MTPAAFDDCGVVMAGLVPAIHAFLPMTTKPASKAWMPATQASEATPSFGRLCAGMTSENVAHLA
jgi:hypothetical protein